MTEAARNFEALSEDTIAEALSYISPDCGRDEWWEMAAAIKSELGDTGFSIWDNWSQGGDNYNAIDARDTWRSTSSKGKLGIGTLIQRALQNGFKFTGQHKEIDEAAKAARRAKREADARAEAEKKAARQARAESEARAMWEAAKPAQAHPYTDRKGITELGGVRIGVYRRWIPAKDPGGQGGYVDIPGALLVPIRDHGRNLRSIQAYFPDADNPLGRDRDYLPGGEKAGGSFNIGKVPAADDAIIPITEGYATGCSIHTATGLMAVVGFDAGNLEATALSVRKKRPSARIVICADNDRFTLGPDGKPRNPGLIAARKAAAAVGGYVALPVFADDAGQPTDFDDLRQREGLEAVRAQVMAAIEPPAPAEPAGDDDGPPAWDAPPPEYDDAPPPRDAAPAPAANDNRMPAESALAPYFAVHGLDSKGGLHWWDVTAARMQSGRVAKMCSKAALLAMAPATAWDIAIGLTDPTRKFSVDGAYGLLVSIAKTKPLHEPPEEKRPVGTLTGTHGADSAVIAARMREDTLYDEYSQSWYQWDLIWRPVAEGHVSRTVISALDAAFGMQYDNSMYTGTFGLLKRRLGRAPTMAEDYSAAIDAWNNDRNLLPMRNGVLHLGTRELFPHAPDLMMPWMIPHEYDPAAECPKVSRFLEQLAQGDVATLDVLYAGLNAVLKGRADLQKFLEIVGVAGTGKSTYIKICQALVGDANVAVTTMEQLNKNQFETANIFGKRLIVISDADKYGGTVDVFKAITGQDPVRFEKKHVQAGTPFIFGGMVIAAANQPIQFSDTSTAMVRRRVPVHIDKRLDASQVDIGLSAKLAAEIPGLINMLLDFTDDEVTAVLCDKGGRRAEAANRAMCETNPVAAWLNDMVVAVPGRAQKIGTLANSPNDCLYPAYAKYCEKTGRKGVVGLQSFSRAVLEILGQIGVQAAKKITKNGAHIEGIKLRTYQDQEVAALMYGAKPEVDFVSSDF